MGYNATHQAPQLTIEDYVNSRYILNPLRLWDCDRPVNASAAYLFTTAERARDLRQRPVDVLNHSQHNFRKRSTQKDLDEIEDWTDRATRRMYEGAGLRPQVLQKWSDSGRACAEPQYSAVALAVGCTPIAVLVQR